MMSIARERHFEEARLECDVCRTRSDRVVRSPGRCLDHFAARVLLRSIAEGWSTHVAGETLDLCPRCVELMRKERQK